MLARIDKRALGLALALVVALASALSAAHLSAHHTLDVGSIEDCLSLHTTGLDTAWIEPADATLSLPIAETGYPLTDYRPTAPSHFRPRSRAPPQLS